MNNQHENLIRQFNQNPSEPSARELLIYLGRTLTAAAPLSQLALESSASNWNRIWQSLDELATQDAETLEQICAALNICLESWPSNLRVLPPAYYRRFEQIKDSPVALTLLPGLRLIRHICYEMQIGLFAVNHFDLLKLCPNLQSLRIFIPDEDHGSTPQYLNNDYELDKLIQHWPEGLRILKIFGNCEIEPLKSILASPRLQHLKELSLNSNSIFAPVAADSQFRDSLEVLKLKACSGPDLEREGQLQELLSHPWPKLQKLILSSPHIQGIDEQASYQNALPNLSDIELLSGCFRRSDVKGDWFTELLEHPQKHIKSSRAFRLTHDELSQNLHLINNLSSGTFIVSEEIPDIAQELQFNNLTQFQLVIHRNSINSNHLKSALELFAALGKLQLITTLAVNCEDSSSVSSALEAYDLPELDTLYFNCHDFCAAEDLSQLLSSGKFNKLETLLIALISSQVDEFPRFEVTTSLRRLSISGPDSISQLMTSLIRNFSDSQLDHLEFHGPIDPALEVLKQTQCRNAKKVLMRSFYSEPLIPKSTQDELNQLIFGQLWPRLEDLEISVNDSTNLQQAMDSGYLPALRRVYLKAIV